MNTAILAGLFLSVTNTFALPAGLLSALCYVESAHKPKAVNVQDGGSPSIGICQIKEETARLIGFKGSIERLKKPKINIFYAGKYLQKQLYRYQGDIPKAIAAYNAGTHRVNKKGLTKNRKYVAKVMRAWLEGK